MRAVGVIAAGVLFACALSGRAAGTDQAKPAKTDAPGAHLPAPPYPAEEFQRKVTGSGMFQVFFDASGRPSKVVVTRSTGSKNLDENTVSFARKHWAGKPNTQQVVPVAYDYDPSTNAPVSTNKIKGRGLCRVVFDAAGHVSKAMMIESGGSALLDQNTVDFARANWTGPPGATRDVPITYAAPESGSVRR